MNTRRARVPKSRRKQESQRSSMSRKRRVSALDRLHPEESSRLLRALIARHAELLPELEDLARRIVSEVDLDVLAERVERAILDLDMRELGARSGRTIGGYVEPTEVAWELLDEALQPFLADLRRSVELGLEPQAIEQCRAIVLGLYRSDGKSSGDLVLEWAPDFPLEGASDAVHTLDSESKKHHGKPWRIPAGSFDQVPDWARYFETRRKGARTKTR